MKKDPMNAPKRLPIVRVAIDGAVIIPLNLIEPSPTNPRHRPNDLEALQKGWNLAELAETVQEQAEAIAALQDAAPEKASGE